MKGKLTLVLMLAAACSDRGSSKAASDSILSRDLALAGSVQQAQPTLQDTAFAPAPVAARPIVEAPPAVTRTRANPAPRPKRVETPAPIPRRVVEQPAPQPQPAPVLAAPAPAPTPAPVHKEIGAGTGMALTSGARVCTNSSLPGDKIVATVSSAVTGTNGAVIPAGSTVVLEVASVTPGSSAETTQITFRVRSIVVNDQTYNVAAEVTPLAPLEKSKVGQDPNADKKKVIGGAVAGAILGQILGKNTKSTVIGAAAGAAAGAAVAKSSEKWEGCLPEGSPLRVTLNSAIVIS